MSVDRPPLAVVPPRPDFDDDPPAPTAEPWVTTAADLVAYLLDDTARRADTAVVVTTGNAALDGADGGLAPGTLTAVLAAPGPHATAALVAAAHHAAYHQHHPTLLYPLRSTAAGAAAHLAAAHARSHPDRADRADAVDALRSCPLYVSVGSPITAARIMADALDEDMDPPRLIVVDAVTLLHPGGASRDLKRLALELNVAVLCATTIAVPGGRPPVAADAPADLAAHADTIVALAPSAPAALGRTDPLRPVTDPAPPPPEHRAGPARPPSGPPRPARPARAGPARRTGGPPQP